MHITESRHPDSHNLDQMPTVEVVRLMNQEDARVVDVVSQALPAIAALVDKVAEQLRSGGRLFYVGAGTSGRNLPVQSSPLRVRIAILPPASEVITR